MTKDQPLKPALKLALTFLAPPQLHRPRASKQATAAQALTIIRFANRLRERTDKVNSFEKNRRSLVPPLPLPHQERGASTAAKSCPLSPVSCLLSPKPEP
jgi:hypothetical protein